MAACLLAVHPLGLGGVCLKEASGTAAAEAWLARLKALLPPEAPVRRLPVHTDAARLLGGLDLTATLQAGRPVAQRGLLAQCDGGLLLVPMAERMEPPRAALLASVLDARELVLEREGLSQRWPARLAVVAFDDARPEIEPSEGVPPALAGRLGLRLALQGLVLSEPDARTQAQQAAIAEQARSRLPAVRLDEPMLKALLQACEALGVPGLRPGLHAAAAARASAAWAGREAVAADDLAWAVRLVLAPLATRLPVAAEQAEADDAPEPDGDDPAPAEPPSPEPAGDPPPPAPEPPRDALPDPPAPPPDAEPPDPPHDPQALAQAAEALLGAALAALPPGLLAEIAARAAAPRGGGGAGRAGAWQRAQLRGRPCGSRRGELRGSARLHLIDTLRAAAPWQRLRRQQAQTHAEAQGPGLQPAAGARAPLAVHVRPEDFHLKRQRERRESTTVFLVDASGSAALHRLAEAKGAVELLLADCYVRRDRVALLAFSGLTPGSGADLLLPPTRSLVRARRALAALPGGGGTPLAAGLHAARQVAMDESRRGASPLVVVLSDGRANLALDGSPGRERAHADALRAARAWAEVPAGALWLDIAPQPQPTARALAEAMGARYLPLPHADARQVSAVVRAAGGG